MAGTADQARPAAEPAQEAIAAGRPETLAGVSQVQKGEMHQLNLGRACNLKSWSTKPWRSNPFIR
jgi:hypothetical protein